MNQRHSKETLDSKAHVTEITALGKVKKKKKKKLVNLSM
jgi:hypothetical protein